MDSHPVALPLSAPVFEDIWISVFPSITPIAVLVSVGLFKPQNRQHKLLFLLVTALLWRFLPDISTE